MAPTELAIRPLQSALYTYTCGHSEPGAHSYFIGRLLFNKLIKPQNNNQLLVCCPSCRRALSMEDNRGNIVAALELAASEGTKDAMTILIAFADIWEEFRENGNEGAIGLLQLVYEAMGKAYQHNDRQYRRILGIIRDNYNTLTAVDIACTVIAKQIDPGSDSTNATIYVHWKAYDNACYRFWDCITQAQRSERFLPMDLTLLVNDILNQGMGYATKVLGSPQEEDLHFEIARKWCKRYVCLGEDDLVSLRDIMVETTIFAGKVKLKLHQLSWRTLHYIPTMDELDVLTSKIRIINAMAKRVKQLDIEKRERWGRWRELTRRLDPIFEATLGERDKPPRQEPTN